MTWTACSPLVSIDLASRRLCWVGVKAFPGDSNLTIKESDMNAIRDQRDKGYRKLWDELLLAEEALKDQWERVAELHRHHRAMDLFVPVGNLFDLMPDGRGDWSPKHFYHS